MNTYSGNKINRPSLTVVFLLGIVFTQFFSCASTDDPIGPDVVPKIKIISISPQTIQQFQPVEITVEYEDGDGNLGEENPDTKTLSVKDSRLPEPDMYHIPPLSPPDTEVPIKGTFKVTVRNVFLFGNGDSEQLFFTLQLKDKSGNSSNSEQTQTITVNR
ncbi:MAG: hypothetical protein K1X92_12590 [Bacteroidia bacterium]|nr:hypothetical protein [Bacteroidia bacterium]